MPPKETTCLEIIHEARSRAEELKAAGNASEDKAAQRGRYELVGIRWLPNAVYYDAEFEEGPMTVTDFFALRASHSKPKPLVEYSSPTVEELETQPLTHGLVVRIKWRTASFEIDDIDREKALRFLGHRRLIQQLSVCSIPEKLLYWSPGEVWDLLKVDEKSFELYHR